MGMSIPAELNSEFDLFEPEDILQPGSPLQFIDDTDTLHTFGTTNIKNNILSPGEFLVSTPPATSPDSPNGSFQDSYSDSASSKRTASSTSSNPASHSGDVAMADGPPVKPEWPALNDDFTFRDDDPAFAFDGTIDPSSLDANIDAFNFNDKLMEHDFDFESASSSPSPFANKVETPSPELSNKPNPAVAIRKTATAVSKQKRHAKALSQFSLTQGMNGLNTNGSREVSPLSNMISQESSPGATFNNSPSPGSSMDFIHTAAMNAPPVFPPTIDMRSFVPMPYGRPMPMSGHEVAQMAGMQFTQMYQPQMQPPKLTIHPTPFKSRVETQIPIRMSIYPLPLGIKKLHLPTHTISKPKLLARPAPERSSDMLELYTTLVCTSAMQDDEKRKRALARAAQSSHTSPQLPEDLGEDDESKPQNGGEVRICTGCITRERKRAARKKIKKVEEEELWSRDEHRRVIVFNTQEIKEWQPATSVMGEGAIVNRPEPSLPPGAFQVECPMRIACYCRHQNEKQGFQVIFTLKDCRDRVVAQEMSNSIMITDDHKTHTPPILSGQTATTSDAVNINAPATFTQSQQSAMTPAKQPHFAAPPASTPATIPPSNPPAAMPRNLSRPASPSSSGPSAKKRKASGSIKLPTSLAMTPRDAPPVAAPVSQTSPFTPNAPSFPMTDGLFSGPISQPFATSPSTPNNNDQVFFNPNSNRNASIDAMAMPLYSAPTSAHPSRAPSPNGLRNSVNAIHQAQIAQAVANGLYQMPISFNPHRPATIHKIIPNEGPKSGGVEVTILGSGFFHGLEVMFGDQKATTTTFWGETSLVCLLPPSPTSGTVLVAFKQQPMAAPNPFASMAKQQSTFKYIDDDEHQLIRSALAVLGQKMTGKMEDARDLARRILGDGSSWGSGGSGGSSSQQSGGGGFNSLSFNTATETQLLKVLELVDLDDSPRQCRLDLTRKSTGQTMLHLACALGLHRLVAGLLSRGADPDAQDNGEFTPMHLAAMNGHLQIVRRLVSAGANPTLRSKSGLTPSEIAPKSIARGIRKIERHARSSRGRSLLSRVNSAASLRSLWEGPSQSVTDESDETQDGAPSEESLEYSEFWDSEGASDTDDGQIIGLHRRSSLKDGMKSKRLQAPEANAGLPSPTAAMAAWREQMTAQFQQLQQVMMMPFQNLAQFPSLPPMPGLQEYQANLAVQQGMRKLAALMPNIPRPGPADGIMPDSKWWDALFTSSTTPTASPPAYEDLYPQQDLDKKQASAAQAAAEAEADMKCAIQYDEASETTSQSSSGLSTPRKQLPTLLQLGRRHAITEEQKKNLQQLHAEKFTRVSKDRKLFLIWLPLLLIILCAFLNSNFPSLFMRPMSFVMSLATGAGTRIAENVVERIVEVQ